RDFAREFRGEVLLPSGLEALEQLGLDKIFTAVPRSRPSSVEIFANARPVLTLAIGPDLVGPHGPTAFSQPAFLAAVVADAGRLSTFTVELGAVVVDLLRNRGRIAGVVVDDGDRQREIRADLVIGADGRASAVRRHGGFGARRQGLDVDVVWFKTALPDFYGGDTPVRVYLGRAHLLIAYAAADGRLQVAWVITKGSYGELRSRGVEQWLDEMCGHVTPDLAEHLRGHRDDLSHTFLLSAVSDRVESWWRPGALLIGDAAHTMSPVGGQGINIALRDAVVAANHLVPPLLEGRGSRPLAAGLAVDLDAACAAIEKERLPELEAVQRIQAAPPRILMGRRWWSHALRATLPRLLRSRMARRAAAPTVRTLLRGEGEVRLQV
ncbi:MAG: FAD-dependent monooxygenase, partial [Thermoanaerobaculia bacterium]|nr:FAD-dependent monooxygenase [Thermoanaerobaculia bacterium]